MNLRIMVAATWWGRGQRQRRMDGAHRRPHRAIVGDQQIGGVLLLLVVLVALVVVLLVVVLLVLVLVLSIRVLLAKLALWTQPRLSGAAAAHAGDSMCRRGVWG
jgi:uncharacterized membrane protein